MSAANNLTTASPHNPPPPQVGPFRRRHAGLLGLIWAACNLALLVFRPSYPFPASHFVDTWIYTAFQWDITGMSQEFGATYYGARLSWIYPGALLHHLFDPTTANLILKLGCSAILATTLALFGWRASGIWSAAIGIGLAVFSPQIITALHLDYTDTPVMVYGLLCISAILLARDSKYPFRWITLAGIAFTMMALSNLGAVANLGVGIAMFHLVWINRGFFDQLKFLGVYLLSALFVVQGFQLIHQSLGNDWHILGPQWAMVTRLNNEGTDNPWYVAGWAWMSRASWLIIPFSAVLWGAVRTYFRPSSRPWIQELSRALTVSLAFALFVGFFLQLRGSQVLGLFYYASSLLCLALPLLLLLVQEHLTFRQGRAAAVTVILAGLGYIALVPPAAAHSPFLTWLRVFPGSSDYMIWLSFGGILISGLIIGRMRKLHRMVYPLGAASTLLCLVYLTMPWSYKTPGFNDRLRERYTVIHNTFSYLSSNFQPDSYRFWIDRNFTDAAALASSRLWLYRLWVTTPVPSLVDPIVPSQTIIVPTPIGSAATSKVQIDESLARHYLKTSDYRVVTISGETDLGFDLNIFKISPEQFDPQSPPPGMTHPPMVAGYEYFGSRRYSDFLYSSIDQKHATGELIEQTQSGPLLQPTHPDISVYTDYRSLPKNSQKRRLGLVVHTPFPGSTQISLEDNFNRPFATIDIPDEGRSFHIVIVPDNAHLYRLRFSSTAQKPTVLPTNINIYEIPHH